MHDSINGPSAAGRGSTVIAGEPRVRDLHTEPGAAADVQGTWGEVLNGRAEVDSRRAGRGHGNVRAGQPTTPGADRRCHRRLHRRRDGPGKRTQAPGKQSASKVLMAPLLRLKWQCR